MGTKGLTPRQQRFVTAYAKSGNATQSAIEAGYPPKSAHARGYELVRNREVQAALNGGLKKQGVDPNRVLKEISRLAFSDFTDAFNEDGTLKPLKQIPPHARRAISGIEVTDHMAPAINGSMEVVRRNSKLKLWDKPKALELLAKHLRLLGDGPDSGNAQTLEINIAVVTK